MKNQAPFTIVRDAERHEKVTRTSPASLRVPTGDLATEQAVAGGDSQADAVNVVLERLTVAIERIANKLDPPPPDVVGTEYLAERLGCTATWVAEQARDGRMPARCIVPGTGQGKPWKFYRSQVDEWLLTGR